MSSTVDIVVVTYNPNIKMLIKCINSLRLQVRKIWIVDNSPIEFNLGDHLGDFYKEIDLIELGENKGIAFAQNVGMQQSIKNHSDYILLSDQDTGVGEMRFRFCDRAIRLLTSLFSRLIGIETKRLQWAKIQKKRLGGLLELDIFDEKEKQIIKDIYLYYKGYTDSFVHIKTLLIGLKYSRVLYNKNYFYYNNFIRDFIG